MFDFRITDVKEIVNLTVDGTVSHGQEKQDQIVEREPAMACKVASRPSDEIIQVPFEKSNRAEESSENE